MIGINKCLVFDGEVPKTLIDGLLRTGEVVDCDMLHDTHGSYHGAGKVDRDAEVTWALLIGPIITIMATVAVGKKYPRIQDQIIVSNKFVRQGDTFSINLTLAPYLQPSQHVSAQTNNLSQVILHSDAYLSNPHLSQMAK